MPSLTRNRTIVVIVFLACALFALATSGLVGSADAGPFAAGSAGPVASPEHVTGTPPCTSGVWMDLAPYPISAYGVAIASNGGGIWGFGGKTTGGAEHAEFFDYYPLGNVWTAMPPMPTGPDYFLRADHWGNGKIYVIGGFNHGTQVRIFDLNANTWVSMGAPVPAAVHSQGQIRNNGKIYVIGGVTGGVASANVYAYDILSNTWTARAPMPQAEFNLTCDTVGGLIYCAGGTTGTDQLANLWIYDVAANTWSTGPPMPIAANAPGGTVFDDKFWVVGGGDQPGPGAPQSLTNTQIYDPVANSWSAGPTLLRARSFADAASDFTINGEMAVYVAGYDAAAGTSVNNVEGFVTMCSGPSPTPSPFTPSPTPTGTHTATVTPTCLPAYTTSSTTGVTLTPGTTNIGGPCDNCATPITLPFPVSLYGMSYTSAYADSNGVLQFTSPSSIPANTCLPGGQYTDSIFAHWDDLRTDAQPGCASFPGGNCGIFTAVTGSAPNRIFVVEWRAAYAGINGSANFEILLHENSANFEVLYGALTDGGFNATSGVQEGQGGGGHFTQFSCNNVFLNNRQVNYTFNSCMTPTATPTASPTCGPGYTTSWVTGTLTAATNNTGNSCDDCITPITLPFPVSLYGNSFTSAMVDSNGVLAFTSATSTFLNTCLPYPNYTDAIFPYWDDLITDNSQPDCASFPGGTCGIFTAVTGSAPNRTFVVEWRATYFSGIGTANFEILLHENSSDFEVVYGGLADGGASATTGVQQGQGGEGHYTQFSCNATFLNNSQVIYTLVACVSPTPTATGTSGPTPTSTGMSPTATATGGPSSTCTPAVILYDQTDNGAGTSTTAQNFEAKLDGFDSEVADDFMVPSGSFWNVTHVNVSGNYFAGIGPADSVNVVFYNMGTLPGNAVCTFNNVPIASGAETGSFGIDLPGQCSLNSGIFWVSVQANMNFTPNGQWGWKDRTVQTINGAAFRNSGGAFMCSTNDWVLKTACVGGNAPDQIFQLIGTTGITCGTPSGTPTHTPTATSTATNTPTATLTPTADPTPSASSPGSPTATSTATFTPTNTPTNTPTADPTPTPSSPGSPTLTPTATATATNTPTPTVTHTPTPTNTATHTPTNTPTSTPTITPSPTPPLRSRADFDGDGRTDMSVYRPSEGYWYYQGTTTGFNAVHFGESTDIPAPGDFDGDRKTDISVFRPSTGYWYRLDSSTGTFSFVNWGLDGDIPQAGDYDGDGLADQAVFRPSNGSWYWIRSSDNQQNGMQFGQNGDKPVTADYDGDGTTDISVFRGGLWYRVNSSDGSSYGEAFGLDNDIPTPADYDADGQSDISVFRPSDGNWYFHFSGNSQYGGTHWGQDGDIPVPGDYDGDNHYDTAVYRDGIWYIDASTEGSSAAQFGLSADIPIPK